MTCAWYEKQLANQGVELWRNGRPSATLLEHARGCSQCDRLVEHELRLKLMFTELAEQTHAAEPGAQVKRNLLAELEAMRPKKVARFSWVPRFAIAAAVVACLVLAFVLVRRATDRKDVAKSPEPQPSPAVQAPVVEPAAPVVAAGKKNLPKVRAAASRQSSEAVETANDFYPTVMCDSITCAGPAVTVRVELPASPLSARRSNGGRVMADLLVGEDGLVRGVRLLQ